MTQTSYKLKVISFLSSSCQFLLNLYYRSVALYKQIMIFLFVPNLRKKKIWLYIILAEIKFIKITTIYA